MVKGHVSFEHPQTAVAGCLDEARMMLQPVGPVPGASRLVAQLSTGSFTTKDVPTGRYRIQVTGLAGVCYLRDVRLGETSSKGGSVFLSGESRIELIFATDGGVVSGVVRSREGAAPVAAAQVLLVADGSYIAAAPPDTAATDNSGRFRFASVPPGSYQVLAQRKIDSQDYLDPAFRTGQGAVSITVNAGDSLEIEVGVPK